MVKLPISDYVANYYKEQGIEFTLRQQAHFCWYYNALLKDQLNSVKEVLAISEDEKLNTEIRERITYEEKAYECFLTYQEGCIYIVRPDDEDEYEEEYFASAKEAISYGTHHCDKYFEVVKRWLFDQNPKGLSTEADNENSENINGELSQYRFTSKGNVICGWSKEHKALFDEEDYNRFEYMFLCIESPFGPGDIVMGPDFTHPVVVSTNHDCFTEHYNKRKDDRNAQFDSTDNVIIVDYICTDGTWDYDHVSPFDLWKVDSWEDKEYWELLQIMSAAEKNDINMYIFNVRRQQYGERNEKNKNKQVS